MSRCFSNTLCICIQTRIRRMQNIDTFRLLLFCMCILLFLVISNKAVSSDCIVQRGTQKKQRKKNSSKTTEKAKLHLIL